LAIYPLHFGEHITVLQQMDAFGLVHRIEYFLFGRDAVQEM
jgi:hypothetical protein